MDGLEIDGKPGENTIEFKLGPKEEKLIKLKSIGDKWKIQLGVSYIVE